jgi:hypothetical protein
MQPKRRRGRRIIRRVLIKEKGKKKKKKTTMHHTQGYEKNALGRSISCGRSSRETTKLELRFNQQTNKQTKVQLQLHQQNKTTSFQTLSCTQTRRSRRKVFLELEREKLLAF